MSSRANSSCSLWARKFEKKSCSLRVIYLQQRFIATLLYAKKKKNKKKIENRYSRCNFIWCPIIPSEIFSIEITTTLEIVRSSPIDTSFKSFESFFLIVWIVSMPRDRACWKFTLLPGFMFHRVCLAVASPRRDDEWKSYFLAQESTFAKTWR